MGTVYIAEHVGLGQRRAVKFLRADLAHKPGLVKRFLQEARALSSMHHANLVGVVDMGEHAGAPYYVMEHLEGEDLRARLRRRGGFGWAQTRAVALQVCAALQLTHARSIVHRDLKPENCFCVRTGSEEDLTIKVIDFGVAKVPRESGGTSQLTGTGETLGTMGYMAPEQLEGQGDHRVDIYSLGAMMFEMLAGRPVYVGNAYEIIAKMLLGAPPTLGSVCSGVDPAVERLIATAIEKDPSRRFASMQAFAAAIAAIPASAAPQIFVDRRVTAPDQAQLAGVAINDPIATMSGPSLALQDTHAAPPPIAPAPAAANPTADRAVVADPPARPWRARALVAALGGIAAAVVWAAWPARAPPAAIATTPPAATSPRPAPPAPAPPAPTPVPPDEPGAVDPGSADPIPADVPPAEPGPADVAPAAPRGAARPSAPGARPLSRDELRRRLERALTPCRVKFADEEITIRVTPGRPGKLASVDDARLASATVRCLERELARVTAELAEGVDGSKTFDMSLTLARSR